MTIPSGLTTRLLSNCYVPGTELGGGDQKMCYTVSILGVHHAIGKRSLNRLFQTSVANDKKKKKKNMPQGHTTQSRVQGGQRGSLEHVTSA